MADAAAGSGLFSSFDFGSFSAQALDIYKGVKEVDLKEKELANTNTAADQSTITRAYATEQVTAKGEIIEGVDNNMLYIGGGALGLVLLVLILKR